MTKAALALALRNWVDDSITAANVRAAVKLLIDHGHWLTDDDFTRACINTGVCINGDLAYSWIDWPAARVFAESRPDATIAELAMLRLIVDLGSDRYRFARLDAGNLALAKRAFSEAAGPVNYQDWRDLASVYKVGAARSRGWVLNADAQREAAVLEAMADRCDEIAAGRGE